MTPVPAPSRAGSSTTMSGRPRADSTSAGVTSPSRTRRVGKVAPLCRASAQARRSRSTARTEPDGPTAAAKGTEKRPGAGVEVHHRRPLARPDEAQHRLEQRRRGAGVDLPEDPGRNPVGATADDGVHGAGRAADLPADHDADAEAEPRIGQARGGAAPRRDRDHRLRRIGPRHDLELGGARPQDGEGARRRHGRAGDGALLDVLDPVGAVAPEPHGAPAVHRDPHPGAVGQTRTVPGDRFHLDGQLQAGQPLQLLGDAEGLQPALGPDLHVLEVAAAAAPGAGVRAGRLDPVGGGAQDLDGVRPQVGGRTGRDLGPDPLAGEAVADEDHLAVGRPGHAAPAGGNGAHLELQEVRGLGARRHGR